MAGMIKNLFARPVPPVAVARTATESSYAEIETGSIRPDPTQPRRSFDEDDLLELGKSMAKGQLEPVLVRYDPSHALTPWTLIDGERRLRAAQKAGLHTIAVRKFVDKLSAEDVLEMQLTSFLQRQDLKPVEQAHAFRKLMELKGYQSGSQLAVLLHVHPSTVTRALAMIDKLVPEVQEMVDAGKLPAGTAYELTRAPSAEAQKSIAWQAANGQMTRVEVAVAVTQAKIQSEAPAPSANVEAVHVTASGDGLAEPRLLLTGQDIDKPEPTETVFSYTSGDAEVTVRFPRQAQEAEAVAALEELLGQARLLGQKVRLAA